MMEKNIRMLFLQGLAAGGGLTGKRHEGTFWDGGNVLYFNGGGGIHICQSH